MSPLACCPDCPTQYDCVDEGCLRLKNTQGRGSLLAGALANGSPSQPSSDANPGGAAPGRVVHMNMAGADAIYIGRPSKWGNPFRIGWDGDRAAVIARYEEWVKTKPELLAALPELRGKTLACYCAPKQCHGDVLVRLANDANRGLDDKEKR